MKTRITELLGLEHPIVQAAMGRVAGPAMVVATCNAGALGILGSALRTPEELRQEIRQIRELIGGRAFAVNLTPLRPGLGRYARVILEERVPVFSSGFRDPFSTLDMKRPDNLIYIPTVGNVRQAVRMEQLGADAVIVASSESGGHSGTIGSMVLIPRVVESVRIPVIAAGGFSDGKGLAAALALGAEGIAMGTRFALTQESLLLPELKAKYLEATERDVIYTREFDGFIMSCILGEKVKRNPRWWTRFWELLPTFMEVKKGCDADFRDMIEIARVVKQMHVSRPQYLFGMGMALRGFGGDLKTGVFLAGQVVGRISDIPTCRELIERTVTEARQIIEGLTSKYPLEER